MSQTLGEWHVKQINNYSFIKNAYIEKRRIVFVYDKDGEETTRRLSVRASVDLLQDVIKKIKSEVGEDDGKNRGNYYVI